MLGFEATPGLMPLAESGQTQTEGKAQTQNGGRNITTASGVLALLGLLKKDNTLTFAGTAGALYSLYRYDEDSKSKDRLARARAQYFSRDQFYRDGVRYNRKTVTKSGKRYYQFVKAPKNQQDWKSEGQHDNRNNDHNNRNHDKGNGKGKRGGG